MNNAIEFNGVWKKFRRGEKFNALRDAIPNMVRQAFRRPVEDESLENREFWAVQNVSFEVAHGDVVGIIGPNGAGKSTILKLLSRIMEPTRGSLSINGRLSALIEVTAGFHPELTGRENVYLNGTILGMKRAEIDDKFEQIVEFSGLRNFIDTPVKRYSSGMFSRLGFSVAAHINPDVLLVDEVLSVGDIAFQAKCAQKMRELLNSGVTIVLVSHNINLIQNLCKRVLLLKEGQVIKEGAAQEVVPYYENLVLQEREEELRGKLKAKSYKVKVDTRSSVEVKKIELLDDQDNPRDSYPAGQPLHVRVHYAARQRVERLVFALKIERSDGIVCCISDSRQDGVVLENIEGEGVLDIYPEPMNLIPGVYSANVSVWDPDMIHPYDYGKASVFKIEVEGPKLQTKAVLHQPSRWSLQTPQRS